MVFPRPGRKVESWSKEKRERGGELETKPRAAFVISSELCVCF